MMFEHRRAPLVPFGVFLGRLLRVAGIAAGLLGGSLAIGVAGYHGLEGLPWIDALHNAAMILTGMGPVDKVETTAGKLFASAYALFSGVVFLTVAAVLFAPVFHRFIHKFHLEIEEEREDRR